VSPNAARRRPRFGAITYAVSFDPYQVLGLDRQASTDEIRQAYRSLARKYHPDINKEPGAEERFKELGQAYSVLSDEHRRALYDEFGEDSLSLQFDPHEARRQRRHPSRREESRAGEPPARRAAPPSTEHGPVGEKTDADVRAPLEIDLGLAIRGGELSVPSPLGGASLTLSLPPGVESGYQLRVRGRGRPGIRGGRPGDLYFEVHVQPHPFFHREGLDLHLELPLTIAEALHGATIDIPGVDGWLRLPVPAESHGGERLRLRGKGLCDADARRGDLYVHLCVRLPDRLDAAARSLDRLAGLYSRPVREGLDGL
jgi:curved DNA-binding protein